jgi:DNA (cytosine-5)-methyltransferase 1
MRLLDLYCKAGGCTKGYQELGFEVVGVDKDPQPNYVGDRFIQADALVTLALLVAGDEVDGYRLEDFDAIHASPPCQASSSLRSLSPHVEYPELIPATRELLKLTDLPWAIENVVGAALVNPVTLCGSTLCPTIVEDGERFVIRRHRIFETTFPVMPEPCTCSPHKGTTLGIYGGGTRQDTRAEANPNGGNTRKANKAQAQQLMEIDWMTRTEMCQAIPPSYTRFIGGWLVLHLDHNRELVAATDSKGEQG